MVDAGIFIAVEGIDGAGKTTQVALLEEALRKAGEDVFVGKEPTTGPWGTKIRDSATNGRLPLEEELEAFLKDREQHLEEKIKPALNAGRIVILDRYFYSTISYQGARGGDIERLDQDVRELAVTPDIVFVLDLDPAVSMSRIRTRDGEPNEFEKLEDLRKIRTVFQWLCEKDEVVHCLDGTQSPETIRTLILDRLLNGVLKEKRCAKSYGCDDPYWCGFRETGTCQWWRIRQSLHPLIVKTPKHEHEGAITA